MITILKRLGVSALLLSAALGVNAQNQFEGANIFATGDNPPLDGFNPSSNPALQLLNDGTGGDAAAGDGIWTRDVFTTSIGNHPMNRVQWKVASAGFSPVSIPSGTDNSYVRPTAGSVTKFVFDTVTKNDGFVPDPNGTSLKGYLYTVPSPILTTDTLKITGSFVSELGGTDWDVNPSPAACALKDDGAAPDVTAGDQLYTTQLSGLLPGAYDFKATVNGSWDMQISGVGFATGGNNLSMNVIANTDTITIVADAAKGRIKVTNNNPLANPGPPFFATSPAWGETLSAATQMYDNGTNGDVTSGDGIHSRVFTVASITDTTGVKVRQGQGPTYPGTGEGYPFSTTAVNQSVLVQFDTNTYADGYSPNTRYVWTDPASRRATTYVQAVGDFMNEYGGVGDWNNNDPLFQLSDGGANGDVAAGDKIFAATFAGAPPVPGANFKALAQQGSWDFQLGGAGDGYTYLGNNPNIVANLPANATFQADSVTGRVGIGSALPFLPATRNATAGSAVNDWSMY